MNFFLFKRILNLFSLNKIKKTKLMKDFNTPWRRLLSAMVGTPDNPVSYAIHEYDITKLEEYLEKKDKNGEKISLLNCFTFAVAKIISEKVPEFNSYVKRGKIFQRKTIDILITTKLFKLDGLNYIKIHEADKKSIKSIAEVTKKNFNEIIRKEPDYWYSNGYALSKIPWPLNKLISKFIKLLYHFGITSRKLGISPDLNGSIIISDTSKWNIKVSFGAILPKFYFPNLFVIGIKERKPIVINNNIEIRTIIYGTLTADHRIHDGEHAGKFLTGIQKILDEITEGKYE